MTDLSIPMSLASMVTTHLAGDSGSGVEYGWRLLLGGVTMLGIGIVGLWLTPGLWDGRLRRIGARLRVFGPEWGRVGQSIMPFTFYVGLAMGLGVGAGFVAEHSTGFVHELAAVAMDVFASIVLIGGILIFSIISFNQPWFLVPPYARDFNGVVPNWVAGAWRSVRRRVGPRRDEDRAAPP